MNKYLKDRELDNISKKSLQSLPGLIEKTSKLRENEWMNSELLTKMFSDEMKYTLLKAYTSLDGGWLPDELYKFI